MLPGESKSGYVRLVVILSVLLFASCGGSSDPPVAIARDQAASQTQFQIALSAVTEVRAMADDANNPYPGTLLAHFVALRLAELPGSQPQALCSDYATTLVQRLTDVGVTLSFRTRAIAFNDRAHDSHAVVEILDSETGRWSVLDPTFGLLILNASGLPATAGEISDAARGQNWKLLSFQFLTPAGGAYARAYYLDYPLLYLNVYDGQSTTPEEPPVPLTPYLDYLGVSAEAFGAYTSPCQATDAGCADGYFGLQDYSGYSNAAGVYSPHWFVFTPAQ